jgi:hypothetical protein
MLMRTMMRAVFPTGFCLVRANTRRLAGVSFACRERKEIGVQILPAGHVAVLKKFYRAAAAASAAAEASEPRDAPTVPAEEPSECPS